MIRSYPTHIVLHTADYDEFVVYVDTLVPDSLFAHFEVNPQPRIIH